MLEAAAVVAVGVPVRLANKLRLVAGGGQQRGEEVAAVAVDAERLGICGHAVLVRPPAGDQRGPGGKADGAVDVGVVEADALSREGVEVGRADERVAGAPERIGTVLVAGDEQDVGPVAHSIGRTNGVAGRSAALTRLTAGSPAWA